MTMSRDQSEIQRAWERTHQKSLAVGQPDEGVVAFIQHIGPHLPPNARILDAGCGRGRNALHLCEMGFEVYGCDVSSVAIKTAIAQARQKEVRINVQIGSVTRLPYQDKAFTAAICVHVLPCHLTLDIDTGVRELWRVLQASGWVYVDFLDREDAEYGHGQELEPHTFLDSDGVPVHFGSQQEINEWLDGFVIERMARVEGSGSGSTRVAWTVWARKETSLNDAG